MIYSVDLVEQFWAGLMKHLPEDDIKELSYATGATASQIDQLKMRFPAAPEPLIRLLERVNGTYWQQSGDHKVAVLILGSDVFEYPYYLKSVEQMLTDNPYTQSIRQLYAKYFDQIPELVGEGINPNLPLSNWLCFSDCMNNGGTSSLFLDFDPAPGGTSGQVVRYLHDPDSFKVIASSFESYLQKLIDEKFSFLIHGGIGPTSEYAII
jgi:cell wall assembly regulator SMI1